MVILIASLYHLQDYDFLNIVAKSVSLVADLRKDIVYPSWFHPNNIRNLLLKYNIDYIECYFLACNFEIIQLEDEEKIKEKYHSFLNENNFVQIGLNQLKEKINKTVKEVCFLCNCEENHTHDKHCSASLLKEYITNEKM